VEGDGPVDGESMRRAGILVDYFKGHARRVYAAMDVNREAEAARKGLEWIVREGKEPVKRWEPYGDLKNQALCDSPDSLDGPLSTLVSHNIIRENPSVSRTGPGRKPAPTYSVNPLVHHPDNPVNPANGRRVTG